MPRAPRRPRRAAQRPATPLAHLLRRRRGRTLAVGIALALAVVVLLDRQRVLLYAGSDVERYDGQSFLVTRVIDGDTLEIAAPDAGRSVTRVRLWGIDAPEHARTDPPRPAQPGAQAATDLLRTLAHRREVVLTLEPNRTRGGFGRLLAHVTLPDGTLASRRLLDAGLARADPRWDHAHLDPFARAQDHARAQGLGLWSDHADDLP